VVSSAGEGDDTDGGSASRAYAYESAHTLAWIATFGLILEVATSTTSWMLSLADEIFPEWYDWAGSGSTASAIILEAVFGSFDLATFAVWLFAAATFLFWLHRVSRNAWVLYPSGMTMMMMMTAPGLAAEASQA
jgi:hypothetical protein